MNKLQYPEDRVQILGIFREREFEEDEKVNARVSQIIEGVRQQGDRSLFEYTQQFDGVSLDSLQVDQEEIDQAYQRVEQSFIGSLNRATDNISDFHRKQLTQSWFDYNDGGMVGQKITPLK
ncbi:MAG: histidinol dehydrogenase, partial [Bacillota bacterium]